MFHKLNGSYARAVGLDPEVTKAELKYWHGEWVSYPFADDWVPEWPGRFVELFEGTADHTVVYLKSEAAYDRAEESRLIEGAMIACMEVGADLSWMDG